jgi:hypothetical protein
MQPYALALLASAVQRYGILISTATESHILVSLPWQQMKKGKPLMHDFLPNHSLLLTLAPKPKMLIELIWLHSDHSSTYVMG